MTLLVAGLLVPRASASCSGCTPGREGATTHTLCGCGDPALFLWFFQWPATALAHGQNPFFSTALFHPARHQPVGADLGHRAEHPADPR